MIYFEEFDISNNDINYVMNKAYKVFNKAANCILTNGLIVKISMNSKVYDLLNIDLLLYNMPLIINDNLKDNEIIYGDSHEIYKFLKSRERKNKLEKISLWAYNDVL